MAKKVTRNTQGMKDALFDELDSIRAGKSTPQQARATASIVSNIIATARLEMDYARFVAEERAGANGKLKAIQMT